jgi:serine/threonine protein kinase
MPSLIGQSIGRYHILEQLGEGGMAIVYKAYDTRLERDVAIKIILPIKQQSEKSIKRFEREARALAQLTHPNIIHINDFGEHDGMPFLVMDYVRGGTLKSRLGAAMPWQEAVRVVLPIARALEYAHKHGIIHRDVKPSNILIAENGEPMLSDFGVAKLIEAEETLDLTGASLGLGTPEYMAPEYMTSKNPDQRVDIYALGIVLYELVTGRKPYQADTPLAVLYKQASEPLQRPSQLKPDLSKAVEEVILKALAKNPANRYKTAGELAAALERLNNAGTAIARETAKKRQARQLAWLAGGILALALVAAGTIWLAGRKASQNAGQIPAQTASPTGTPIQNAAAVPPTRSPAPTNTLPIAVSTSAATSIPDVFDDFNDPAYDGTFDRVRWEMRGGCKDASQTSGVYLFNPQYTADDNCVHVARYQGYTLHDLRNISRYEANVWLADDFSYGTATQEIQYLTIEMPGNAYWVICGIIVDAKNISTFFDIRDYGQLKEAEYHIEKPAEANRWYNIRMEIDPDTMEMRCLVDNVLLGSHIPLDADLLRKARFELSFSAARFPYTTGTTAIDDIRISKLK